MTAKRKTRKTKTKTNNLKTQKTMKKLFISMLAVAALVSCSKEQTIVADKGELIGFNSFVENSTRATDPSYGGGQGQAALTEFKVWGTVDASNGNPVAIYANDTVTGTAVGASNIWNCTTKTQYWIKDAKYNFAALVHAGNVTLGADLLPAIVEFTATTGSTDLMYARSTENIVGLASQNDPVNFTFAHLLSKVYIGVTNNSSSATGYSFLVKNIKINAPKTSGKYYIQNVVENSETISAGTWKATAGDYTFANISVTGATAECAAEQLLIPGDATVSFDVDIIYNNATITTKQYSKSVTLSAGNAYRFNILASVGEEIKFSVESQPTWSNQPAIDLN
jgi:hypothetical protein